MFMTAVLMGFHVWIGQAQLGVMANLIVCSIISSAKRAQAFTPCAGYLPGALLQVSEGVRAMANGNGLRGEFRLAGIPPCASRCAADRGDFRHLYQQHPPWQRSGPVHWQARPAHLRQRGGSPVLVRDDRLWLPRGHADARAARACRHTQGGLSYGRV